MGVAAVRGDEPTTVTISGLTVVPIAEVDLTPAPPQNPFKTIDPTRGDFLEVCDWDYCVVHTQIGNVEIDRFLFQLELEEARSIASAVTAAWGVPPVRVSSEPIPGEVAGTYDPNDSSITLDQPIVAWTLLHELAHHLVHQNHGSNTLSHGPEFLEILQTLAADR